MIIIPIIYEICIYELSSRRFHTDKIHVANSCDCINSNMYQPIQKDFETIVEHNEEKSFGLWSVSMYGRSRLVKCRKL